MNYREIELLSPKDLGTTGTEPIDLDTVDPISMIEIILRITVATVSDMLDSLATTFGKILIEDGSDVLTSLTGEEAQALAFYTMRRMPLDMLSVVAADYMYASFPIYFGRKLYDPEYALDPKKFKNPKLQLTWDEDACNTGVVANQVTVRGWVFDEKSINPSGFLMAKEVKSYTPAASSEEATKLPTDYPLRLLMMQSESTDKNPFEVLAGFKLSENDDKRVPVDLTGLEIFQRFVHPYGPIHQNIRLNETAADAMAIYATPTYDQVCNVDYDDDVVAANDEHIQCAFAGRILTIGATVNKVPYRAHLMGYAPHFCFPITFGDIMDRGDAYDVTKLEKLKLLTTGAAAVGTSPAGRIVTQQYRSY